jgi:hypothetical protein
LRFVTSSVDECRENGNHYARLNTADWWHDFLQTSAKIKMAYLQGREYDINNCYEFIKKQAGGGLKTIVMAHDGDIGDILDIIEKSKLNKKQEKALHAWDNEKQLKLQRLRTELFGET